MKTKYLFGMLLSGVMLAACTADDDLRPASVAQDVNPSAPVFTVHFNDGDLQNRASYNMSGANMDNLSFEVDKDRLSLFHGMAYSPGYTNSSGTYFGYSNDGSVAAYPMSYLAMTNWQNAIYKGENTEDANTFTFATQAMVNKGRAILVYPGDTDFSNGLDVNNNGVKAPNITISLDQDENTKNLTPYMSEIINIAPKTAGKELDGEAGYGHKYDIALKRVGSTLFLNLALLNTPELKKNLNVKDIEIKKVRFEVTKGNKTPFTKSVPVKVKTMASGIWTKEIKPAAYSVADKAHLTWFAASELDLESEDVKAEKYISTSDVTNKDLANAQAIFTLLPMVGDELKSSTKTGDEATADEVVVTLYTNYGTVTVSEEDIYDNNLMPWVGRTDGEGENMKITDGLNGIFDKYVWKKQTRTNSMFYNTNPDLCENVGAAIERTLNVQMKDQLEMNGLHVKTEAELIDAIKVYQYLHPTYEKPVYFYLDGDAKGVFTMTDGTWKTMMDARNGKNNSGRGKIYCVPCGDPGEACAAVKLVNTKEEAVEVPELAFGDEFETNPADIQLDGNWTFTGVASNKDGKTYLHVGKIVVLGGADLQLVNDGNKFIKTNATSIEVLADGNVGVEAEINLCVELNNYGFVTVGTSGTLNMDGNKTLTNHASATAKTGYDTKGAGVINNSGKINAINTAGALNNFGVINNVTNKAETLITNNGDDIYVGKAFVGDPKKTLHRIGTINLCETVEGTARMAVSVGNSSTQGFIKLRVTKKSPVNADFGQFANYIIVDGNYDEVKYDRKKNAAGEYTDEELYLPGRVIYLEVKRDGDTYIDGYFDDDAAANGHRQRLRALLVTSGKSGSRTLIASGKVVMSGALNNNGKSAVFVKDDSQLWYNGNDVFSYGNAVFQNYFGGSDNEADITTKLHNYGQDQ